MTSPVSTAQSAIFSSPLNPEHQPDKVLMLQAFSEIWTGFTGVQSGALIRDTKSNLDLVLAAAVAQMAWVIGDSTPANNGVYENIGTSSSAVWTRRGDLPFALIPCTNAGAGSANAIVATSTLPIPTAAGKAIFLVNISEANTSGTVTLSINGTTQPVKTNTGNNPSIGGLAVNSWIACVDDGTNFRLLSDQASAAIQAAAEAAQAAAETAQAAAEAAALTVVALGTQLYTFDIVADMLADTVMSYTAGGGLVVVNTGDTVVADGFRYTVQASGATVISAGNLSGYHLITAGGVKLKAQQAPFGFNVRAFGAVGDYSTVDTTAFQRAIWALGTAGGRVFAPNGGYQIDATLSPAANCSGFVLDGESFRATALIWEGGASPMISLPATVDNAEFSHLVFNNTGTGTIAVEVLCFRSRFTRCFANPTVAFSTAIIKTDDAGTTYNHVLDDCHLFSSQAGQEHAVAVDFSRGNSLTVIGGIYSGHIKAFRLGVSAVVSGASFSGVRIETFSGETSPYPGDANAVGIDAVDCWALSVTGCNFEIAADQDAVAAPNRAIRLVDAQGVNISGNAFSGGGQATRAINIDTTAGDGIVIEGNLFHNINGYGVGASNGGATTQAAIDNNALSGGTTGQAG